MAQKQPQTKSKVNANDDEKKSFSNKIKNFFGLNKTKLVDPLSTVKQKKDKKKIPNDIKKLVGKKKSFGDKIKNWFQRKKVDQPTASTTSTEPTIRQLRLDLEMEQKKRIDETRRFKNCQSLLVSRDKLIEQLKKDLEVERKQLIEKNQRVLAQIECIKHLRKQLATAKTLSKNLKDKYSVIENELHHVACEYLMDTSTTAYLKKTHRDLLTKSTKSKANN
jgi:hypothetical protein